MTGDDRRPLAILVVEDESLIAMELRQMLEDHGFDVIGPAPTIPAALALLEDSLPDACVLDVNLRGQHSAPVAADLRARGIPFVLSSAYAQRDLDRVDAFEGITNVGKPATSTMLLRALTNLVRS